ncbi:MAG: hypothetical protein ABL894_03355 [Hyphomicrobium sp.]
MVRTPTRLRVTHEMSIPPVHEYFSFAVEEFSPDLSLRGHVEIDEARFRAYVLAAFQRL